MSRLFFSMLQRLAIVACTFFVPLMPFYVWQNLLRAQRSTEPIQFLKLFITYSTKIRILIVCATFFYIHTKRQFTGLSDGHLQLNQLKRI